VTQWIKHNWPALVIGAAVALVWITGAWEWIIGAGLGLLGDRRQRRSESDVPEREPVEDVEPSTDVEDAAREHMEQADAPDADTPEDAIRQQAEDLP